MNRALTVLVATIVSTPLRGQGPRARPAISDSVATYSGVYVSSAYESILVPCDVPGVGSGWWVRFRDERAAAFLHYPITYGGATRTHFIRVRGRVSPPGHYGLGFQMREIVVDSLLDVNESIQPCLSYEDIPQPWNAVKSTGAAIAGTAVTDDGVIVATLDVNGVVSVWNAIRGHLLKRFPVDDNAGLLSATNLPLALSRDGKQLAVAGVDGAVRVWNPLTGEKVLQLTPGDTMPGTVNGRKMIATTAGLDFNQSGTLLATTAVGRVRIYSTRTGALIDSINERRWETRLTFIGDSSFVINADSGMMKIYPRPGVEPVWKFKTPLRRIARIEKSPDGRSLILKGDGDTVFLWSLSEGQVAQKFVVPNGSSTNSSAMSPDGKLFLSSGGANGVYVWDAKTGRPLRSFQKFRSALWKVWFTANSRSIVAYPWTDSVLRVVYLDPKPDPVPVQVLWGANSWPPKLPPAGTSLGSIVGFVRDQTKRPLIGADIAIFNGDKPGSAPIGHTTTNAAGRYLVQQVKVPHVVVRAMMRGYAPDVGYAHLPSEMTQVDIELKPNPPSS